MTVAAKREAGSASCSCDLATIYEAEVDHVWRTLRRFGVRHADLEDLCHEVFVTFYRTSERFDTTRSARPWLSGIAFRVATDWSRRAHNRREQPTSPTVTDAIASSDPRPDEQLASREERDLVLAALQDIDPARRAVLVMHDLDEETMPLIAEALQLPLNTAYSRLRLARADFANAVQRRRKGAP